MASRSSGPTTTLIVSPRGQITLPKRVRARLRLASGSVLLLREEGGKIVLDPAAVTPVSLYVDDEVERLVKADRIVRKSGWRCAGAGASSRPRGAVADVADLRVFLDANVLFTAAYSPDGLSALLIDWARRPESRS